jgi:flavodoxin
MIMEKTLIIYYSYEGSTERIANYLSEKLSFDIEKITPVNEKKRSGFSKYIWGGREATMKKKPMLNPIKSNFDEYDTVLMGSPIWAGTMTPPIYFLLEGGMIKDKKIGFFYCSGGGAGKAEERIRASIEKHNKFLSSLHLIKVYEDFDKTKEEALNWANEIL